MTRLARPGVDGSAWNQMIRAATGAGGRREPGHHGTPAQRLAASTWAADYANAARDKKFVEPSTRFEALFDAKLPDLVDTP
ncbi:hypothetical protein Lfu02_68380 [Longispora fulva]|uniref:Sugar (Pentulose or hexulose) kinase n=1 Tax=Longispora fulva TaxID=619741 RepID=A0A8J7GE73_9ACTN|nr:hypothetical protein [Longispora fulva]MBG6134093.1 sugar (pentulose or hexulose) kinase [Longispora fulva]GIG62466.1 hypothetical protein Lfu02_68380 [Longispora fulva]